VQIEAPDEPKVSVTLPAAQVTQATVEEAEYFPAVQAVQDVAPVALNVFVT